MAKQLEPAPGGSTHSVWEGGCPDRRWVPGCPALRRASQLGGSSGQPLDAKARGPKTLKAEGGTHYHGKP